MKRSLLSSLWISLVLLAWLVVPASAQEARISWIVEATTGTVTLQKAGDEFADPSPVVRTPVKLVQGDRLVVMAGSRAAIFDGRTRDVVVVPAGSKPVQRVAPAPPPAGSVLDRLLLTASQRSDHVVGLEHISRPGIQQPEARIRRPLKDGLLLGEDPPAVIIKLDQYTKSKVVMKLTTFADENPATKGAVLAELKMSSKNGLQRCRWNLAEDKLKLIASAKVVLVELLVDDKVKDTRRLLRMSPEEEVQFQADAAALQKELGIDDPEKLGEEAGYDYLLKMHDIVESDKVSTELKF